LARSLRRGTRLGKYQLERPIDRGAFAEVWRARDTVEDRRVALKVTHVEAVDEWGRKEIEKEARIVSSLDHPNIAGIRNADWIDGRFVIASDLAIANLAGWSRVRRSTAAALKVIRDVGAGLAYAHERRLIHRDVKPENILIYADGHAALADFGASRFSKGATRAHNTDAGTLGYMAPEQAYGRVRFASDVFSLGLIAYETLTGVLPMWPFEWPPERYDMFVLKAPEAVRPVLRKAAQFDPKKRYRDAGEFHQALEAAFARADKPTKPKSRRRTTPSVRSPLEVQAETFRRAHGKGLGLRYECRRCAGPISEEMKYCPWCGADDNSFHEVTSFPLVCPDCEKGVRPEWTSCPWCYAGRFAGNGRNPPRDTKAVRVCAARNCEGQLRPFMRYCPLCKKKPGRVWSHEDLPDRCPRCRWPTSHAFLRFCPWCGRREHRAGSYRATRR
jgi:serine/threonine protein kinase